MALSPYWGGGGQAWAVAGGRTTEWDCGGVAWDPAAVAPRLSLGPGLAGWGLAGAYQGACPPPPGGAAAGGRTNETCRLTRGAGRGCRAARHNPPSPPPLVPHFLSVFFFPVSFCPCLPGPLGLDNLPPTSPPCSLTA